MIYNPIDTFFKSQTGGVKEDGVITFRLNVTADNVFMIVYDENGYYQRTAMQKNDNYFCLDVSFKKGLYWYYFDIGYGKYVGKSEDNIGEITGNAKSFQLTVYGKDYKVPSWISGGIIYQIFPDRFNRAEEDKKIKKGKVLHKTWNEKPVYLPNEKGEVLNNDFFGGDLQGIIQKLDYLKDLGVSVIYLNPIFEAYSNHRYDTGDYMKIDNLLGTEKDLKELIDTAEKKGIKIILDGVFNHTGSNSKYFNKDNEYNEVGAYQSKKSKYYDWYNFNNYPDDYCSWWGIKTLPAVNKENGKFLDFIAGKDGVLEHYTKLGIGGWRLDVVDELPEAFSEKIRKTVKGINKDAFIYGEVWEDASNKIAYEKRRKYFLGKELDSVMNYPLKNAILNFCQSGNEGELKKVIREQVDHYPEACLNSLMNILSTHDTVRLLSALSNIDVNGKTKEQLSNIKIPDYMYQDAIERLKTAVILQYTLCGVPSIYYGDEVGMEGYVDPLNRQTFPWNNKNFDILSFYQKMGKIRNISAFSSGKYSEIIAENGVFAFKRRDEKSEVLVAVNLGRDEYSIEFNGTLKNLLDGKIYTDKIVLNRNCKFILVNDKPQL